MKRATLWCGLALAISATGCWSTRADRAEAARMAAEAEHAKLEAEMERAMAEAEQAEAAAKTAQTEGGAAEDWMAAMSDEERATMEVWMAAATPGEQHARLAEQAGRWKIEATSQWEEGGPEQVTAGISEFETILDGRYLMEHSESPSPMGPFRGMGIIGYDNVTERFVNVWLDNTGTGVLVAYGEGDAAGSIHWKGTFSDAMKGTVSYRATTRRVNKDRFIYDMYEQLEDKERRVMRITYTRT